MAQNNNLDILLKPYTIRKEAIKPGRDVYVIDASKIRDVMQVLRDSFNENLYLATIAGVDKLKDNIFELNYFIHIVSLGKTIVVRTSISRTNPKIDSILDIIPGAYSAEMEIYDLLGIEFIGNKHLKRSFFVPADVASQGIYPLRKDASV